jgi:hypothetical protein
VSFARASRRTPSARGLITLRRSRHESGVRQIRTLRLTGRELETWQGWNGEPHRPSKECGWKPLAYRVPVLDPTRESKSLIFWLLDSGNSGRNKFMAADGASLSVQRVWSGRRVRRFGSSVPLSGRRLPAPSEEQMRGQPPSQGAVTMSLVVVTDQMKGTAGGPDLGCIRKDTYYEYANSQGGRWPRRMQRSSMSKFRIGPMSMSGHDHSRAIWFRAPSGGRGCGR